MDTEKTIGVLIIIVGLVGVLASLGMVFVLPGMVVSPLKATLGNTAGNIDELATKVGGYKTKIDTLSGEFKGSLDGFSATMTKTSNDNKKSLTDLQTTISGSAGTLGDFGNDLGEIGESMDTIGDGFKKTQLPGIAEIGDDFAKASILFGKANKNSVSIAAQLETSSELLGKSAKAFDDLKDISTTIDDIGGNIDTLSAETVSTLGTVEELLKDASSGLKTSDVSGIGVPFQALGMTLLFIFLVILSIGFNYIKDAERSATSIQERARLEERISFLELRIKELGGDVAPAPAPVAEEPVVEEQPASPPEGA